MNKICKKCNSNYPVEFFSKKLCTIDGLQPHCKLCNSEQNKKWNRENKEKHKQRCLEYYKKNTAKPPTDSTMFLKLVAEAKSRGYSVDLTYNKYKYIIKKPCFYCGGELPKKGHKIDRPKNSEGYVQGNYVPCCAICNRIKHTLDIDVFLNHIKKIQKHTKGLKI